MAPDWCEDPRPWFPCSSCGAGLFWADLAHGVQLVCANSQCFAAGTLVAVWQAQEHRQAVGLDIAWCDEGWPRPVLDRRPVPYVTPVTAGRPWWRLTDGGRVLRCQREWRCQVCGLRCPRQAWVVAEKSGAVLTDAVMHARCLRLAAVACVHLASGDLSLLAVQVGRTDLNGDGEPLDDRPAPWREVWALRRPEGRGILLAHLDQGRPLSQGVVGAQATVGAMGRQGTEADDLRVSGRSIASCPLK